MILLDTHIWVWWVHEEPDLTAECRDLLQTHESDGLGISAAGRSQSLFSAIV